MLMVCCQNVVPVHLTTTYFLLCRIYHSGCNNESVFYFDSLKSRAISVYNFNITNRASLCIRSRMCL